MIREVVGGISCGTCCLHCKSVLVIACEYLLPRVLEAYPLQTTPVGQHDSLIFKKRLELEMMSETVIPWHVTRLQFSVLDNLIWERISIGLTPVAIGTLARRGGEATRWTEWMLSNFDIVLRFNTR